MPSDLTTPLSLRGISRDGLAERVALKIETFIADEQMTSGMRLPSERVFGRELGVSRTVLREAIRILESKGAIEVIPARGMFIATGAHKQAVNVLSEHLHREAVPFHELVEARRFLEVHVGGLAAQNRTSEHLSALADSFEKLAALIDAPDEFLKEDWRFHAIMASASGNRLYPIWLEPIMTNLILISPQTLAWSVRERIVTCHEAIWRAVKDGDVKKAKIAVDRHIDQFVDDAQVLDRVIHRRDQRKLRPIAKRKRNR